MPTGTKITVFGATGAQGSGVIKGLLSSKQFSTIRAVTRNPDSDKSKALKSQGIEVVKGNLNDIESVNSAIEGSDAVFATFNWYETAGSVQWNEEEAMKIEFKQGKNVVDASKKYGVKHVILSTLEDVKGLTKGALKAAHFDVKGEIENYAKAEGINYTFARYSFYFQNFLGFFTPNEKGEITLPMKDEKLDAVDVDQAGEAVASLFKQGEKAYGREIGLANDSLTVQDYLNIINEVTKDGIERKYIAVPWQEMAKNPGGSDLANMFAFYTDYNGKGYTRDVNATKELIPGLKNFRTWAQENKHAFPGLPEKKE